MVSVLNVRRSTLLSTTALELNPQGSGYPHVAAGNSRKYDRYHRRIVDRSVGGTPFIRYHQNDTDGGPGSGGTVNRITTGSAEPTDHDHHRQPDCRWFDR